MLVDRFSLVETQKDPPVEVVQLICCLVHGAYLWGGHIKELKTVGEMFRAKYGRAFVAEVNGHPEKYVHPRILKTIRASSTAVGGFDPPTIEVYMHEIAKLKGVERASLALSRITSGFPVARVMAVSIAPPFADCCPTTSSTNAQQNPPA